MKNEHISKKLGEINPEKPVILCLPDIRESESFLHRCYQNSLNLILLLKNKWIDTTDTSMALGIIEEKDFCDIYRTMSNIDSFISLCDGKVKIDHVVGFSERNVEFIAKLNERYCTEGIMPNIARLFRDKWAMKKNAEKAGLTTPKFALLSDKDAVKTLFDEIRPKRLGDSNILLVKPRAGWSSEGINCFRSLEALEIYAKDNISNPHDWIVEEYVTGEVYYIDGVVNNMATIFNVTGKYHTPLLRVGTEKRAFFSAHTLENENTISQKLLEAHQQIVESFGLKSSTTHMEFFLDKNSQQLIFCEAAARPPGMDFLKLHQYLFGTNALQVLADIYAEQIQSYSNERLTVAGMISFTPGIGTLSYFDSLEKFNLPGIVEKEQTVKIGQRFETKSYLNELGRIYFCRESEKLCQDLINQLTVSFNYKLV